MPRGFGFFLTALAAAAMAACGRRGEGEPTFIGSSACARCHRAEMDAWMGSQHAVAMQRARENTVLAPFAGERVAAGGSVTMFTHSGTHYEVRAPGAEGAPRDFTVRY